MAYETELTRSILKSKMAKKILRGLTPKYGGAYVALWIIEAIGQQLDKVDEWTSWDDEVADSFKNQVVPQTATWFLPYWEAAYGIKTDESIPIEQRRQEVVLRQWQRLPMNPARVELILKTLCGYDVRIEERTGRNEFKVYISALPKQIDEGIFRQRLNTLKPAHLMYQLIYEKYIQNSTYIGGVVQTYKEITLKQV